MHSIFRIRPVPAIALLIALTFSLAACKPAPKVHHATLLVFGTLVEITLYGVDDDKATAAINAMREDFNTMHSMWHPWKAGPLGRTNQLLATGSEFSANPSVLPLIEKSRALCTASRQLYNPAIGKLLDAWGFHSDEGPKGPPPSAETIKGLVNSRPQISDIVQKGVRIHSTNPAVKLDFGAMAKGLAVDREIDYLKSIGIKNAIINAGGDLKVIGSHGDRPWRVGVRNPRQSGVIAGLDVADGESVFTSGDYERFFKYKGKRYHHIIDPRSGYPADKTTSVTVIHEDAATADAAATALFVAGPEEWRDIAKDMGLHYVMLIDKQGRVYMTPAMAKRIEFEQQPEKIIVSPPL